MKIKIKRILLFILAFAMVAAFSACNEKKDETTEESPTDMSSDLGFFDKDGEKTVLSTDNFSVSLAQFEYLYMNTCLAYSEYAQYLGFTTDIPLKDQPYTESGIDGYTWHDSFVDMTKAQVNELLILCEGAKERGIELNDEDKKNIDDSIASLKNTAEEQNMSFEKFLKTYFGERVTEEDIRTCIELHTLASKAEEAITTEKEFTDEEMEEYCADNKGSFYFSDYRTIEIKAYYVSGATEETVTEAKAEAKALAENILNASKDENTFLEAVEAYYRDLYHVVPDKTEETEDKKDEAEKKEEITESKLKEKIDATLKRAQKYTIDTELGKWLCEQDLAGEYIRKAGDAKLIEDDENGKYTVYLVTRPIYREDYKPRDVRHILITTDDWDEEVGLPDKEAKAKAEALLKEWKDGEATAESFGELAKKYSMDYDASNGGLYEEVTKGMMVEEFEEWLFAAEKPGDTDVVKTEYGYHVMYYVGEGDTEAWKLTAMNGLSHEYYEDTTNALAEAHPITAADEATFALVKQAGV